MTITLSRGRANRAANLGDRFAMVMDDLHSGMTHLPARFGRRRARRGRLQSIIGRPWSAEDILMVIVWVMTMPFAAARFESAILMPPFVHLPAHGSFVVASVEALLELAVAAMLARACAALVRRSARRMMSRRGGTSVHVPGRRARVESFAQDDAAWIPVT